MKAILIIIYANLDIRIPMPDMYHCQQFAATIVTSQEVEMICASREQDA